MRWAADPRIVKVALNEDVHSDVEDDDEDDDPQSAQVRLKAWRNPTLTSIFRACDAAAQRLAERDPKPTLPPKPDVQRIYSDPPIVPADPSSPPLRLPYDIVSASWFNNVLTVQERSCFSTTPILPSLADPSINGEMSAVMASLSLNSEEFMHHYGAVAAGAYHLPTEEDLRKLRGYRMTVY